MDLTLSDEQRMLAEVARSFVERSCSIETVRELEADPVGFRPELWQAMAALGWAGLVVPEGQGGAGRGMLDLVVLCEQLGRGGVATPLLTSTTLATLPLLWAGSAEQQRRWLPALAAGTAIGTLAVLEPGMHDEWDDLRLGGVGPLRGTKVLVPWAGVADLMVVATADGLRLIEAQRGGIRCERHQALGADPLYTVTLDGADAEPLDGPEPPGAALPRALDHAAVATLGYAVGAASRALDMSVQYAAERHQFGRPIGSFQAVAHRCVDIRADLDACRLLAQQAAWALDRGGSAELEVAAAKAYANEAMRRIFMHAHQVHGAIGFSLECDLQLFTRRAKAFELSYGSTARARQRLATAMGLDGPDERSWHAG